MGTALSLNQHETFAPAVVDALQHWLRQRLPAGDAVVISEISKPSSGFSAQTWVIVLADAKTGEARRRVVARVETEDPAVYPQQAPGSRIGDVEVALQFEVMSALHRAGGIPLAPLIGFESDEGLLGQPFFVMEYVAGDVASESPPYPVAGFFTTLEPETRRAMLRHGLETLAAIHDVPWRKVGLEWLVGAGTTPSSATQLELWQRFAAHELAGRVHPALEAAWELLHRRAPLESEPCLAWGDPRPGNIIWRDGEVAAVTDFEAAAIAPPELDLGWWLMFDRTMHEIVEAPRLPGDLTREEQAEHYAAVSGRDVSDIRWYEIFAAARYCAIVVRVMNRAVARGMLSPEQMIWLQNPAADCLVQLLDDVR